MFSGIVQEVGTVKNLESKNGILELSISSECLIKDFKIGSSVSVNGCCQTVVEKNNNSFKIQATDETLKKTNLSGLQINSKVNLEPSLKLGQSIDGHLVSGHVDMVGKVSETSELGENKIIVISYPQEYEKYIASKGSISVNGVSLTVINSKNGKFDFTLIPFTRDNTNLGLIKIGDLVNLEIDLISRYLVNYLENRESAVKI